MVVDDYVAFISAFIEKNSIKNILEIGCGDFLVGSRYADKSEFYTILDVVNPLVDYNISRFGNKKYPSSMPISQITALPGLIFA